MERVQVLIDRLQEQKQRNESAAQLLVTVQLLQQELVSQQQQQATTAASRKVSVVLPTPAFHFSKDEEPVAQQPVVEAAPVTQALEVKPEPVEVNQTFEPAQKSEPAKPAEMPRETFTPLQSYNLRRPSITELLQEKGEQKETAPAPVAAASQPVQTQAAPLPQPHFNVVEETPTLLQHTLQEEKKIHKEVNQIIHGEQRSLNDQLKQQKTEVAHILQDAPIKDLRKAIGINDKFVFLNELFNGDEAMYERSIKTINNFHVLQEAEYWINRELKLRLGWNDTKDAVQHFYQLVRRRFS